MYANPYGSLGVAVTPPDKGVVFPKMVKITAICGQHYGNPGGTSILSKRGYNFGLEAVGSNCVSNSDRPWIPVTFNTGFRHAFRFAKTGDFSRLCSQLLCRWNSMDEEKTPQLKILVVDDDILSQQMMKFLLMQWGHEVSFAGNGMEAVEEVKANRFDIVFMDLQMPGMDGVEASRKIHEWEKGKNHTYIVALTAAYLPEDGQKLYESGIDNYIAKPFEVEHIRRLLDYTAVLKQRVDAIEHATPAGDPSIQGILNIQRGIERVGFSSETYWFLLRDFIAELPDRVEVIENALALQDFEAVSRAAHNLKGVSANLGALQLSEYAGKLDKASGAGYTQETADLVDEIRTASAALQQAADRLLTRGE